VVKKCPGDLLIYVRGFLKDSSGMDRFCPPIEVELITLIDSEELV
jgi:hypothetical protein